MVNFDKETVRETLTTTLDAYGVTEDQDGIPDMINGLCEAVLELYEKAAPKGGKGKGKSTPYTRFISHLSQNKEAIADLKVQLSARFGSNSNTKKLYTDNQDQFEDGEEVTVGELLTRVEQCMKAAEMKQSQMTKGAFVWNMLDDTNRDLVMATC